MSPHHPFLLGSTLVLLLSQPVRAQLPTPPDTLNSSAPATAARPSPVLPWWLPNAQECAGIRAEEARTAPRQAQRREKKLRRWAAEQPEPTRAPEP
ncbi:hypothetical protein K3G63_15155 [Hymenobacter sp. HSC-4F20]|uniref:hypothetical protein n=1 Tax=Hymenobacter sp. HSC-4F20 TaxID=2864135 RepID=UPI001C7313C5|nr:hypothetical protein [Hymenobacter sp. HSC-4F20]MBX0291788.1 hypothetical protein [Hymenobacter sp. HSC-4F20]